MEIQLWTAANNQMTNVVTDPLGNDTAYVFTALNGVCNLYFETTTRNYQGASSGRQILQQIDTTYQLPVSNTPFTAYQATVYPSNKIKLVQRTPDFLAAGVAVNHRLVWYPENWNTIGARFSRGGFCVKQHSLSMAENRRYLTAHLLDLKASGRHDQIPTLPTTQKRVARLRSRHNQSLHRRNRLCL